MPAFDFRHVRRLTVLAALATVPSCDSKDVSTTTSPPTDGKPVIAVVNYPLKYIAERLGGDVLRVEFPVPRDQDPAFWIPDAESIRLYQEADLILLNGAGYAAWVERATLPETRLLNTSSGFRDQYIAVDEAATHSHGPEGEHTHRDIAFTTWLDPQLAVLHAGAVRGAFARLVPSEAALFESRYKEFERDLLELDRQLQKAFARIGERPLLASHPVYQYLTRRYGLNVTSLHWEPDAMPDDAKWQELQRIVKDHPAKTMLWEGAPLDEISAKLSEMGIASVVFSPCGKVPDEGDFLSKMTGNLHNVEGALPR